MSLLSTLDDITDLQPEPEEKEEGKATEEAPKLPRTNSLEDLGIKVLQFFFSSIKSTLKWSAGNRLISLYCLCQILNIYQYCVTVDMWQIVIQLCFMLLKLNSVGG